VNALKFWRFSDPYTAYSAEVFFFSAVEEQLLSKQFNPILAMQTAFTLGNWYLGR